MSVLATSRKPSATPQTGRDARLAARAGTFKGQTAGVAPGYVQGNLAILPANLAGDFLRFCQLNPKPCPLLAASAPGDFRLPTLADDLDIRTDLPRYRVFRNGKLVDEPTDIRAQWRGDLVAFVLGCSFSFEEALVEDGIELRHITCNATVPMYRTSIATTPAGPFHGPMVVSMRPMKPDYGDPVPVNADEIPVFWACGVTPQSVVATVKPEFCITHYPGSMLVTDRRNSEFAIM